MDDFPAGPASPRPRRLCLSVVVPVYNGGRDFERCLRRLRESTWADFELLVVDDGSTDDSAAIAHRFGATVIRHDEPRGPAAARNTGAKAAAAPWVFFVDADVAIHADALEKAVNHFSKHPEISALFGSYDDAPSAPGLTSQYRNLLHHFVHQHGRFNSEGARPAHTFWTGCGAIRRQAFLDVGGFDPDLYPKPAIEDIELGYRLVEAGHRIDLVRDLQATHMKRWTLPHVVKTDVLGRGLPWMLLQWRRGVRENDLNVERPQKICAAAVGLGCLCLPAAVWTPWLIPGFVASLAAMVVINRDFYRMLRRLKGIGFAVAVVPLHAVYYLCCLVSVVFAHALWILASRRPDRFSSVIRPPSSEFISPLSPQCKPHARIPDPKFETLLYAGKTEAERKLEAQTS